MVLFAAPSSSPVSEDFTLRLVWECLPCAWLNMLFVSSTRAGGLVVKYEGGSDVGASAVAVEEPTETKVYLTKRFQILISYTNCLREVPYHRGCEAQL